MRSGMSLRQTDSKPCGFAKQSRAGVQSGFAFDKAAKTGRTVQVKQRTQMWCRQSVGRQDGRRWRDGADATARIRR